MKLKFLGKNRFEVIPQERADRRFLKKIEENNPTLVKLEIFTDEFNKISKIDTSYRLIILGEDSEQQ